MDSKVREITGYNGAVVVVPTRNRARLAVNAIRSVLEESDDNLQVMVSDNSTSERDCEELAAFCSKLNNPRLRYFRPPRSLAMTPHWEWAIEQALASFKANHFTYLTDRMMYKKNGLREVLDLAALYPDKVISYNHDRIIDHFTPIRVQQYPVTGKLWQVRTERLSWLVSQSVFPHGLPRMLNCIVPRDVFQHLQSRFRSVFSSIAPDFNFCFRCLDLEETILFFDKSPLFHYALDRSNGASITRGEITADNADFTANLPVDSSIRNYATPIPQLNTAINAAFNEYLIHKQETMSPRFFDVDFQKYLATNAMEITEFTDPEVRSEMEALLRAHGYRDTGNQQESHAIRRWLKRLPAASSIGKMRRRLTARHEVAAEFSQIDDAIDYARNWLGENAEDPLAVRELLQACELPMQQRFHV